MPNEQHADIIKQGVITWNTWRKNNRTIRPDLSKANLTNLLLRRVDLSNTDLYMANLEDTDLADASFHQACLKNAILTRCNLTNASLRGTNLRMACLNDAVLNDADLSKADLWQANLRNAKLFQANLSEANLKEANFTGAIVQVKSLKKANLHGAKLIELDLQNLDLRDADLTKADLHLARLQGADLRGSKLVETNLEGSILEGCHVYGISVWNIKTDEHTIQTNLVVTHHNELTITVDNLEVAQFIHSMMEGSRITGALNTIAKKCVLILGRFTEERKQVLDAIKSEIRKYDFLPIIFDFKKPSTRTTLETVIALAGLSQFVVADITDPRFVPTELISIVKEYPTVPVQPILEAGSPLLGTWDSIKAYGSVLPIYRYESKKVLIDNIVQKVVEPALEKSRQIWQRMDGSEFSE